MLCSLLLSCPGSSCLVLFSVVFSRIVSSRLVLSCFVLPCLDLSCTLFVLMCSLVFTQIFVLSSAKDVLERGNAYTLTPTLECTINGVTSIVCVVLG